MRTDKRQARQTVARGISAWERDDFESALKTFEEVLEDFPEFADDLKATEKTILELASEIDEAYDKIKHLIVRKGTKEEIRAGKKAFAQEALKTPFGHALFAIEAEKVAVRTGKPIKTGKDFLYSMDLKGLMNMLGMEYVPDEDDEDE